MNMACSTPGRAACRGFTLVEVLVALGIMAMLAVMGWQGIDGIVRTRDASQVRLDQTLRLGTVLAQWEQDLASLQETDAVPALSYDGRTLRLTRRAQDGVQLIAWSLAPPATSATQTDAVSQHWSRWAGPAVSTSAALQDSWLRSQLLQVNDPGLLRMMDGVSQVQLYCYRGNAWSNCQSSGDVAAAAPPASGASGASGATARTVLPTGLRVVLTFADGSAMTARASPKRQHGAALLTAMLIVVLVSSLASAMVWQQWRAVQVESAERARTQSAWILSGALDWARLILREDALSGGPTTLSDPWATPLAEARLSSFLASDKTSTDDAPEAFLSGQITDAQARYNLRNLVADDGTVVPAQRTAVRRLFESVGVAPDLADRLASGLRDALARPGSEGRSGAPPLLPRTVAQLRWLGLDSTSLGRLEPHVVILPVQTPINLNTASREVIAASVDGMDLGARRSRRLPTRRR